MPIGEKNVYLNRKNILRLKLGMLCCVHGEGVMHSKLTMLPVQSDQRT